MILLDGVQEYSKANQQHHTWICQRDCCICGVPREIIDLNNYLDVICNNLIHIVINSSPRIWNMIISMTNALFTYPFAEIFLGNTARDSIQTPFLGKSSTIKFYTTDMSDFVIHHSPIYLDPKPDDWICINKSPEGCINKDKVNLILISSKEDRMKAIIDMISFDDY
jgi:hypothetical protein